MLCLFAALVIGHGRETPVAHLEVVRQVYGIKDIESDYFERLLIGMKVVLGVEQQSLVDVLLGDFADVGLRLEQVVKHQDAAVVQHSVRLFQRRFLVVDMIERSLALDVAKCPVIKRQVGSRCLLEGNVGLYLRWLLLQ